MGGAQLDQAAVFVIRSGHPSYEKRDWLVVWALSQPEADQCLRTMQRYIKRHRGDDWTGLVIEHSAILPLEWNGFEWIEARRWDGRSFIKTKYWAQYVDDLYSPHLDGQPVMHDVDKVTFDRLTIHKQHGRITRYPYLKLFVSDESGMREIC
jgi:hypothetical protein